MRRHPLGLKTPMRRETADGITHLNKRRRRARRKLLGDRYLAGLLTTAQEDQLRDRGRREKRRADRAREKAKQDRERRASTAAPRLITPRAMLERVIAPRRSGHR